MWGSGGIAPPFLSSLIDGGDLLVSLPGRFTRSEESPPVSIGQDARWAQGPVWTLRSREKYFAPAGYRVPDFQSVARCYINGTTGTCKSSLLLWAVQLLASIVCLTILFRFNTQAYVEPQSMLHVIVRQMSRDLTNSMQQFFLSSW
jgi:hypothetical protein